jgi:hypothetical protein
MIDYFSLKIHSNVKFLAGLSILSKPYRQPSV